MAVRESLLVLGIKGLGEIGPGDDLAALIGSRRTPRPHAREISAVTSESVAPPRILPVR